MENNKLKLYKDNIIKFIENNNLKVNNKKNYKQHEKGFYIGYSGDLLTIFYY